MKLHLLDEQLAVCLLADRAELPQPPASGFWSVTCSVTEVSLVCEVNSAPKNARTEAPWRALQVAGPLDFSLTGLLAELAKVLADAGIPLLAIGSFETDYLLVKADHLASACTALTDAGHEIVKKGKKGVRLL